jgi:Mn2+/Fe2+ NRAMP family transporter
MIQAPPTTIGGIIRRIGPGLVLAGSIVGSGELIATTITGAQAGFWLLWLIVIGCVIKVFTQIELGRYAICGAKTTLVAVNEVPGPRMSLHVGDRTARGNWILWFWFLMFLASLGQLGGIVGGVGQALAISWPLSEEGRRYNAELDAQVQHPAKESELRGERAARDKALAAMADADASATEALQLKVSKIDDHIAVIETEITDLIPKVEQYDKKVEFHKKLAEKQAELARYRAAVADDDTSERAAEVRIIMATLQTDVDKELSKLKKGKFTPIYSPNDPYIWSYIIASISAVMLFIGRYKFIEKFVIIMVGTFTVVTILNVVALQFHEAWAVSWDDLVNGFRFQGPKLTVDQKLSGMRPLATALATFGIIGVGASELVAYPYWCLEKGYARFTGPRDQSDAWAERARGWLRVMRWDAWCSMVVYTVATVAFYLLGAAILHRAGLQPSGKDMIRMLGVMYEPVFGATAQYLFLFGAFAVLYSTFFVANAAHTRMATDVLVALKITTLSDRARLRWIRGFAILFPMSCATIYYVFPKPVTLILISGTMQALMLPMLGVAALYFRYKRCDPRLKPNLLWDLMLWLSLVGFMIVALVKLFG